MTLDEIYSAYKNAEISETLDLTCMEIPYKDLVYIIIFKNMIHGYQTLLFAIAKTDSNKPFSENVISEKQIQDGEEIECSSLNFSKEELLTLFKRF